MKYAFTLLLGATLFVACTKADDRFDKDGILLAGNLETADNSGWNFSPMQEDDSIAVSNFKPTEYFFKGKPYTGKITAYDDKQRKIFDGNLEEGIATGEWKFYYPSGVVQIEGVYTNGQETGLWKSYYTVDKPKVVKYYDDKGYILMRTEFYDGGKVKNYQNIKCPQYGDIARRVQFTYSGEVEYLDAERELGKMTPEDLGKLLQENKLLVK